MICPNCGTACSEEYLYCYHCGTKLVTQTLTEEQALPLSETDTPDAYSNEDLNTDKVPSEPQPEESASAETPSVESTVQETPAVTESKPVKGRIWPPILAMAIMVSLGLALFFLSSSWLPPASETPWFTVDNGVLYFDPTQYDGDTELEIPEEVDGQTVTAIAGDCFRGNEILTTVIIPETVTQIGENAFFGCSAIRGLYIPASVESVGEHAFSGCASLEAIYFQDTLQSMGEGALNDCESLRFIIYTGTFAQWLELYDGVYDNIIELHASDGTYYSNP